MKPLAILAAGTAAILPLPGQAAETMPTAPAEAFVAPAGPLILTRTLRLGLADV